MTNLRQAFCALPLLFAVVLPIAAQTPATPLKTTDVLVMLTVKPGVTRDQIQKAMPEEVRATVRLYLAGKIRQWFSRADGKGVVFILNSNDVAEAKSVMEQLPLAKENLVDYEFTAMTPLAPLTALLGTPAGQ
jgi:hypothetical protein